MTQPSFRPGTFVSRLSSFVFHPSSFVFRLSSFVFACLLLALPAACTADTGTPTTKPAASRPVATPMDFASTTMTLKGKLFSIELALSEAQQARGLMYRDSMPADHGMLFIMPQPDTWSFWMDNTYIPLDIIFLDSTGKVLDIQPRAPLDKTGKGPASPALYVLELNLGTADKIGLHKGDVVAIPKDK